MYPHRIRLRGPWDQELLPSGDGRSRFRRRFGSPSRLDDYERLWLTFANIEGDVSVWLNGQLLGRQENATNAFEYEVTTLLRPRNEVVIETGEESSGDVAMQIRRTAFLRSVSVRVERSADVTRLHISSEVAGTAERPLELYVVLDRSTVAYAVAEAAPEGRMFTLSSEDLPPERCQAGPHVVRVDLVDGANVWYTVEQALDFSAPP